MASAMKNRHRLENWNVRSLYTSFNENSGMGISEV
jgi:hypothetical protein